jgi:membrane-bound metal-dependent hydrolase YbcI (DUF457 family)
VDPFTHILAGYLITFGVAGPGNLQYVVAGALAGGLPDADVVLYPLSRRFPLLRHRGITHSIVGVTIIAGVGAFVVPPVLGSVFGVAFATGSPVYFFLAMEAGGLSHILLDAFDHFAVPIFAPFSPHEYHFDADRIVNVGTMGFTVLAYALMLYERDRSPLWVWQLTAWSLLAIGGAYVALRLTSRSIADRARAREGFTDVVPQASPLVFLLVEERRTDAGLQIRVARYHLLHGYAEPPRTLAIPANTPARGPVEGVAGALARSYEAARQASWVLGETHHFAEVRELPGSYEVFWYSLEFVFWNRAAGVLARVDATTGRVEVRSMWRDPRRLAGEAGTVRPRS